MGVYVRNTQYQILKIRKNCKMNKNFVYLILYYIFFIYTYCMWLNIAIANKYLYIIFVYPILSIPQKYIRSVRLKDNLKMGFLLRIQNLHLSEDCIRHYAPLLSRLYFEAKSTIVQGIWIVSSVTLLMSRRLERFNRIL